MTVSFNHNLLFKNKREFLQSVQKFPEKRLFHQTVDIDLDRVAERGGINLYAVGALAEHLLDGEGIVKELSCVSRIEEVAHLVPVVINLGGDAVGLVVDEHKCTVAVLEQTVDDTLHKQAHIAQPFLLFLILGEEIGGKGCVEAELAPHLYGSKHTAHQRTIAEALHLANTNKCALSLG